LALLDKKQWLLKSKAEIDAKPTLFDLIDSNKNSKISFTEIQHLFSVWSSGSPQATPSQIHQWFSKNVDSICAPSYSAIITDIEKRAENGENTRAVEELRHLFSTPFIMDLMDENVD